MTAAVETMAYNAIETPWHGLGNAVDENLSPEEMAVAAGLNWAVERRPLQTVKADGSPLPVTEAALVRTTDDSVLGIVGARYVPVQNDQVMEFFSRYTKTGHMKMETAGSLRGGRFIWGLARANGQGFSIGDDESRSYLLLVNPHLPGYALTADFTSVRVVCWNTLTMALNSLSERAFRRSHLREFDATVMQQAEETLGLSNAKTEQLAERAKFLSTKNVPDAATLSAYLQKLFALPPTTTDEEVAAEAAEAVAPTETTARAPRANSNTAKAITAFESGPGSDLASSRGTWWGALNAVTYVLDHSAGRSQDGRLYQSWLGTARATKLKALDLALEMAA